MNNKVKVLAPFLLTAILASCQQAATPQAQQSAQAAAPSTDASSTDSAASTDIKAQGLYDDEGNLDLTGDNTDNEDGEGEEITTPDPDYTDEDGDAGAGTVMSAQALNAWPTVKSGSKGDDVKAVQYFLTAHGFATTPDGEFGPATAAAVKSFQSKSGLTADGVVGASTWVKLAVTVKNGSKGNAVKALQTYLGVTIDGEFGPATEAAVKSFQSRSGLSADGIVGAQTWQALVAGAAGGTKPAPTPSPTGERQKILARGKVWVDQHIFYSQRGSHDGWRTDCSGFVSMAWNLRNSRGAKISANTSSLWGYAHELKSVDDLQPGDAIDSAERSGGSDNHVVLFVKWIDKSKHIFQSYEEMGRRYGTVASRRQLIRSGNVWNMKGSHHTSWHFLRKNGL